MQTKSNSFGVKFLCRINESKKLKQFLLITLFNSSTRVFNLNLNHAIGISKFVEDVKKVLWVPVDIQKVPEKWIVIALVLDGLASSHVL